MTTRTQNVRSAPVILAVVGALALSACEDRPIVDVSAEQDGRPVLKTVVGVGALTFPSADIEIGEALVASFDATVPNAFGRATEAGSRWNSDNPFDFTAFNVAPALRNSTTDPRLPAIADADAGLGTGGFFVLGGPDFGGLPGGWFDLFGSVGGLAPNTTYTVVLARMALTINGEEDQVAILSGQGISQPDELTLLGGSEAGYPTIPCDFTVGVGIDASMNPVGLGFIQTDANGEATVDCVPVATGDSPWWREQTAAPSSPDSLPFGRNEVGATLLPGQYNYVYLVEGVGDAVNPVPDGPPILRAQVGPDVDATGTATDHGYAPFPTEKVDISVADSLFLPGTTGGPATIVVNAAGFAPLAGGPGYQVKAWRRDTGEFSGALPLEITDPQGNVTTGSNFNGPGVGESFTVEASPTAGMSFLDFSHLVVSHDGAQDSEFLYAEYKDADDVFTFGDMTFGGFDSEDETQTYTATGSGLGEFFGDSLLVRLTRLTPEPLKGFHYQSYLLSSAEGVAPLRLHAVDLDALGNGTDRIGEDEVQGGFGNYNFWVLAMEPDGKTLGENALENVQIQVTEDYFGKFSSFFSR